MVFKYAGSEVIVSKSTLVGQHTVDVPGSKSLTNRFLLLGGLSSELCTLRGALDCEDSRMMRDVLLKVGCHLSETQNDWTITSSGKWQVRDKNHFCVKNAGTAMRFLIAAFSRLSTPVVMDGNERMRVRPVVDLVNALRQLGVRVKYQGEPGCPPVSIQGPIHSGQIQLKADVSSQYLSGLLLVLPLCDGDSQITLSGALVSRTYVEMTIDCLETCGIQVETDSSLREFTIRGNQEIRAFDVHIEPDASTASYWFALPLMAGGSILLPHVPENSFQGDFGLLRILEKMGAKVNRHDGKVQVTTGAFHGIEVNMNTMSDVAPTLAAIATCADSPTLITDVGNMRVKECDRIAALQKAFDQMGLKMESGPDWMRIEPGKRHDTSCRESHALLDPQEDHRMAMVFTLLGLSFGGVRIKDRDCVRKTYPAFYDDFSAVLGCE